MFITEYIISGSSISSIGNYYIIAVVLSLIVLIIASITDFQKREVADFLNYGFFISAMVLRLIYAAATLDLNILLDGAIGFAVTAAIGIGMFYAGQWGGGDTKMIIGLGVLFGIPIIPYELFTILNGILISFIVNAFIVGSLFGLVWSIVLAFVNRKKFFVAWKNTCKNLKGMHLLGLTAIAIMFALSFIFSTLRYPLLAITALSLMTLYGYMFAKSIEKGIMVRMLPTRYVTEGDWIDKDVTYKGKYVAGPKDLGISKKQIELLHKYKIAKVPVKAGIPFIPSFLIGLVLTFIFGNLITLLIRIVVVGY